MANVVQALLPSPAQDQLDDSHGPDYELMSSVLNEARRITNVSVGDQSTSARGKLLDVVSKEISNVVVQGKKGNEAKDRLGHSGDLHLSLYDVSYPKGFSSRYLKYGIRRSHIESAIKSPDQYQHMLPQVDLENRSGFTLFTKFHSSGNAKDNFVLVVQAQRYRSSLAVVAAWRVYLSEVSLNRALTPIDVLREFVETYGLDEDWGITTSKFLFNKKIPFDRLEPQLLENRENVLNPQGVCILSAFRDKSNRVLIVAIAYSIDLTKYRRDIKKHGVHLTP
jgi:hypothetical protein